MKFIFTLFLALFSLTGLAEPIRLALNWKPEPQFGGFYQAETEFKKNSLQVEILEGGSGTPTLQMLLAKQVQYAVVSADELVIATSRGQNNLVALFASFQTNPQALMFRKNLEPKNLEALLAREGTLLWQEGLPYAQFLKRKYSVKLKTAPYLGGLGSFQADSKIIQQCFATSEPLLAEAAGLPVGYFLVAESGYNPYTTVLLTRRDYLKEHSTEVAQIISSVRSGWQQYLQDPSSTNKKMAKANPSLDLKIMAASSEAQKKLIQTPESLKSGLGTMSEARWQALIDQLYDLKLIKIKPKANELFTNL